MKIVSIDYVVRNAAEARKLRDELDPNFGIYCLGTSVRTPTTQEIEEIESQVPEDIIKGKS
jgi:hypothetical protein